MTKPLWTVYDVRPLANGNGYRFSLRWRTAPGFLYLKGFRLVDGVMYSPGYRKGKGWDSNVVLPESVRAAIKRKVQQEVAGGNLD